jgi:hypothetical protein
MSRAWADFTNSHGKHSPRYVRDWISEKYFDQNFALVHDCSTVEGLESRGYIYMPAQEILKATLEDVGYTPLPVVSRGSTF